MSLAPANKLSIHSDAQTLESRQMLAADEDSAPENELIDLGDSKMIVLTADQVWSPENPSGILETSETAEQIENTEDPAEVGRVQAGDHIALHFDFAPDADDGLAAAFDKAILDTVGIEATPVLGAYGLSRADDFDTRGGGDLNANELMDEIFGVGDYLDANADWTGSVSASAAEWDAALASGSSVWVADGGPSDFTYSVVQSLISDYDVSSSDLGRINVVQHSSWNQNNTDSDSLEFLQSEVNYIRIDDGNSVGEDGADFNGTGDPYAFPQDYVSLARDYADKDDGSDVVELLWMLEEDQQVQTIDDLQDFVAETPTSSSDDENVASEAGVSRVGIGSSWVGVRWRDTSEVLKAEEDEQAPTIEDRQDSVIATPADAIADENVAVEDDDSDAVELPEVLEEDEQAPTIEDLQDSVIATPVDAIADENVAVEDDDSDAVELAEVLEEDEQASETPVVSDDNENVAGQDGGSLLDQFLSLARNGGADSMFSQYGDSGHNDGVKAPGLQTWANENGLDISLDEASSIVEAIDEKSNGSFHLDKVELTYYLENGERAPDGITRG